MQRPKWLSGWGEGKNKLEACLLIDIPEFKVVEASFDSKLAFVAIGRLQTAENRAQGAASKEMSTDMAWRIFYDSVLFQSTQLEKAENLMAGIVFATSKSPSVYNLKTSYIPSGDKPSKGNAPLLLDYNMAKKIEEARAASTSTNSLGNTKDN
jgi:hypothetical protein